MKFSITCFKFSQLAAIGFIALVGCSGGGSDKPEAPTWQQGVFENESKFSALCQTPRSGTDSEGNAFPDKAGSTLQENHWLRAWSNRTYLWYNEIVDVDPALSTSSLDYFDQLKTNALTNSGNPKDNFHFTYTSEEWEQLSQSGVSAGYGASWAVISGTVPRQIKISYVQANSPATTNNVGLARGAEILSIDGIDVVNDSTQAGIDALNSGLFPSAIGESHSFTIMDLGATTSRTITMQSASISADPVLVTDIISTSNGDVGYILFNAHNAVAEERLVSAVDQFSTAGIDDLVLDLRYNGGGFLAIAGQMSYMIAGATATQGKTFEQTSFNDKYPTTNPVTGGLLSPTPFYNTTLGFGALPSGQALPELGLTRVFILSTSRTCSASEAIINGLRGIDVEVVLIGDTTCGKPYGFYATDNCGISYFTIQFKGVNDKGFGEYSDGFSPMNTAGTVGTVVSGCSVDDDFDHLLGDQQEGLLAAALNYRDTSTCPAPSISQALTKFQKSQSNSANDFALRAPRELNERILGLPSQTKR